MIKDLRMTISISIGNQKREDISQSALMGLIQQLIRDADVADDDDEEQRQD
jgi:hypothetical protein